VLRFFVVGRAFSARFCGDAHDVRGVGYVGGEGGTGFVEARNQGEKSGFKCSLSRRHE
jgi:hypothetical protein